MHRTLIVMAKAPVPGGVKTRLARTIGADRAARLSEAFLRDTLATCAAVPASETLIAFAPPAARPWFAALDAAIPLLEQPELDLGARISAAVDAAFARGSRRVLVLGSDTPHLAASALARALAELDGHDLVLGPAEDGGYHLVGVRERTPALFEGIEWSTGRVLEQTLARARELALGCALVPATFDVDEAGDLARLEALLRASPEPACAHTRRALGL
jgi:uncharacterized protein